MEINGQQNNIQQSSTPVNTNTAQPVNQQETEAKENNLSTTSTVNLSTEAQKLSSKAEVSSSATPITTKEQAEDSVNQFKKDAANDPVVTQAAQSKSLTSDQVTRLIG